MDEPPATETRGGASVDDRTANQQFPERALSALVFAPLGLALTAWESVPELTTKGRDAVVSHLRNARVVGEFTVRRGRRGLDRRIAQSPFGRPGGSGAGSEPLAHVPPGPGHRPDKATGLPPTRPGTEVRTGAAPHVSASTASPGIGPPPVGGDALNEAAVNMAIPDYEALSASQVVRRLEGLGAEDLKAVYAHEAATRRRRTILNRAQQLLEPGPDQSEAVPPAPGPAPSPAQGEEVTGGSGTTGPARRRAAASGSD